MKVEMTKPVAIMCFSSGCGGMERSAVRLAQFLSTVTTVVLVCKKNSFTEKLCQDEGSGFSCESINFRSRLFSPAMLFKARDVIDKHGIENVIFFGASELKTLHFSFLGKDINLIVWHGTTKSKPKRDFLHKIIYSDVNYHVALSDHLRSNVMSIVPVMDSEKYLVIRPSFNFETRSQVRDSGDMTSINILHVGRVAKGKGQVDAVRACKSLKNNKIDFNLQLIGSSDGSCYEQEVKQAIEDLGAANNVSLLGHVENVHSYLEAADIFLFPSQGEGMPNAFIEALHYDAICIAYSNTVFPEFINMGFYVHLVENNNVALLSEKLLDVAINLRSEQVRAAENHELSKKYFSYDREIQQWLGILR